MTAQKLRSPGALLAHLRATTRPAHEALELSLGLLGDIALDEYIRVLIRFHGFWAGWQPQVAALLSEEDLTSPRQRLHLIERDLVAFGVPVEALATVPRCPLVDLRDAAEALGSLYVMEGSTLGGQPILRNIERCLGPTHAAGSAYFNGYGKETSAMWRSFLARLEQEPIAHAERVGFGATATFERIAWWFENDLSSRQRLSETQTPLPR